MRGNAHVRFGGRAGETGRRKRRCCASVRPYYLPTRPSGAKEGVLVAWGCTESGERVLLDVCLGLRERDEDWLEMGRGLTRRGLRAPWLAVVDGAPGLNKAVDELWPDSDRQRCTVHRLRNLIAKLPKRQDLHNRIRDAYWAALDQAGSASDGEARLRGLVGELETDYPGAAAALAEDLPALCVHLGYPLRLRKRLRSTNEIVKPLVRVYPPSGRGRPPRRRAEDGDVTSATRPASGPRVASPLGRPRPLRPSLASRGRSRSFQLPVSFRYSTSAAAG